MDSSRQRWKGSRSLIITDRRRINPRMDILRTVWFISRLGSIAMRGAKDPGLSTWMNTARISVRRAGAIELLLVQDPGRNLFQRNGRHCLFDLRVFGRRAGS